jgi:hypothetical protein
VAKESGIPQGKPLHTKRNRFTPFMIGFSDQSLGLEFWGNRRAFWGSNGKSVTERNFWCATIFPIFALRLSSVQRTGTTSNPLSKQDDQHNPTVYHKFRSDHFSLKKSSMLDHPISVPLWSINEFTFAHSAFRHPLSTFHHQPPFPFSQFPSRFTILTILSPFETGSKKSGTPFFRAFQCPSQGFVASLQKFEDALKWWARFSDSLFRPAKLWSSGSEKPSPLIGLHWNITETCHLFETSAGTRKWGVHLKSPC